MSPTDPADPWPQHRPNVGIVLFNREGLVFIGRRIDVPADHAWQFPQGGIDPGEDIETAARRELKEETAVVSAEILGRAPAREGDWMAYDFPPAVIARDQAMGRRAWLGQKQVWIAMRFTGPDSEIDLAADDHQEFCDWRWAELAQVPALTAPFKRATYGRLVEAFGHLARPEADRA